MSHPTIYIAVRGGTSNVTPRYTRSRILLTAPQDAARGPLTSWCGIPDFPYAIRNSEFGIPESGIGKFGIMARSFIAVRRI